MSARDRLDTYERDWGRHLRWRAGGGRGSTSEIKPGHYIQESAGFGRSGHAVAFQEVPTELRDRLAKRLEACVAQLVDEEHAKLVEELRVAAVAEAKITLEELGGRVAPPAPPPAAPPAAPAEEHRPSGWDGTPGTEVFA